MTRAVKHGMADLNRVRAAIDRAYKANADRLSPYSPQMVWNTTRAATVTLRVMTTTLTTDFTITDDDVLVEGKIPFLLGHVEGRILQVLGEQLEIWLAKERCESRTGPRSPRTSEGSSGSGPAPK
jgi:hypothetical protein